VILWSIHLIRNSNGQRKEDKKKKEETPLSCPFGPAAPSLAACARPISPRPTPRCPPARHHLANPAAHQPHNGAPPAAHARNAGALPAALAHPSNALHPAQRAPLAWPTPRSSPAPTRACVAHAAHAPPAMPRERSPFLFAQCP
jgi:hypothetical protein